MAERARGGQRPKGSVHQTKAVDSAVFRKAESLSEAGASDSRIAAVRAKEEKELCGGVIFVAFMRSTNAECCYHCCDRLLKFKILRLKSDHCS